MFDRMRNQLIDNSDHSTILPDARCPEMTFVPEKEPLLLENKNTIYVSQPDIGNEELELISENVRSGWLSGRAPVVKQLEQEFAAATGANHAVACNSGGSALQLMLRAAGIGPGDEVIVPAFTMIATSGAVSLVGAVPVFADCDPLTLNVTLTSVERCFTKKTRGVIAVHLYGRPCLMDQLREFCKERNILVFEDAAEAHGSAFDDTSCGGMGDAAAFGMYGNKTITAGEGGMVTTNDVLIADKVRSLRSYCFGVSRHFWHDDIGHSYRMGALPAALCLAQIRRLSELVGIRRQIAERYDALFREAGLQVGLPDVTLHPKIKHSWWFYWIRILNRPSVRTILARKGIETRPGFVPLHRQPCYQSAKWPSRISPNGCKEAERAGREVLLLPTHSGITKAVQERIVLAVRSAVGNC